MYNEKYDTIKKLLKGLNVKLISLDSDKITIKDLDGKREKNLPLTKESLNDKYLFNLVNYEDDSTLLEIESTRYTESLESIQYKKDKDIDVMTLNFITETAIHELCVGKTSEGINFININRISADEGKRNEINVSYSYRNDGVGQLLITDNGYSIIDSEVKMWLADKEDELMETFKEVGNLHHTITNLMISKYRSICEFQQLFDRARKDESVKEYLAMKQSKAVKRNILSN